jgi:ribosomal protein S18 acetylase RimI-like enzyme
MSHFEPPTPYFTAPHMGGSATALLVALVTRGALAAPTPTAPPDARMEWRAVPARDIASAVAPLLASSYVATDDGELRMEPGGKLLRWMLEAPGAREELRVGLALRGDHPLLAFVCALPCDLLVGGDADDAVGAVEVSLLCVRPEWRGRGLTRALLGELRRRAAEHGVRRAIYTSAAPRGPPLLRAACYHCPLRPDGLLHSGFWRPSIGPLPEASATRGSRVGIGRAAAQLPRTRWRRMRAADALECVELARSRARDFELASALSEPQFRHRFLGGGVARSYVLREAEGGGLVGFVAFALLPLRAASGDHLVQAQLLTLTVSPTLPPGAAREAAVAALLGGALDAARGLRAHVFNALALAELTPRLLASLGFGRGDGDVYVHAEGVAEGLADGGRTLDASEVAWIPALL